MTPANPHSTAREAPPDDRQSLRSRRHPALHRARLRRTFASKLKQRGVDSMVVARLLGHTTSRLVDTVYGHLDLGTLRGAMELI